MPTDDDEEERRRRGAEAIIAIGTLAPEEVARLRAIPLSTPLGWMDRIALGVLTAKAYSRARQ